MSHLLHKPLANELDTDVLIRHMLTPAQSSLQYVQFSLLELKAGKKYQECLKGLECCLVILTGTVNVTDQKQLFKKIGTRSSVFEKIPTDSVYISTERTFEIEAITNARIALCYSPCENQLPTTLIKGSDNRVEHRGKGQNKRLVHNILPDDVSIAESLLVVEVFTESGNSSSYPPHKHDQDYLPHESFLEETYYHEIDPKQGFVFQRVYTDDRQLDEAMSVEHQDVVVVPKGYHPVAVPAGYTSYYLNVMAGPKRIWKFHNDPDHEWILEKE